MYTIPKSWNTSEKVPLNLIGRVRQNMLGIATNKNDMWECLQNAWKSISEQDMSKVTVRMLRVYDDVIQAGNKKTSMED